MDELKQLYGLLPRMTEGDLLMEKKRLTFEWAGEAFQYI